MNLQQELERRRQTMLLKKQGVTSFTHCDTNATKIAYFIYTKDAGNNTFMKFVEKLKHNFTIEQVTPAEIMEGILSRFDVLFVGGGMPAEHFKQMGGEAGREIIRKYVSEGLGYIGTCAGAYTAIYWDKEEPLNTFSPSWELLPDCRIVNRSGHVWKRGMGTSIIKLTPDGRSLLTSSSDTSVRMFFQNGPLFDCADSDIVQVLGHFENDVNTEKNPSNAMVGSAAIVKGSFGKGRVLIFSSHPESSGDECNEVLLNSFHFVSLRNI